jgi:anti-sigma regulatory factor (Ser/Thr protein kinase)
MPAKLPQDQQQELVLALVELLVNAAAHTRGGPNESETHE